MNNNIEKNIKSIIKNILIFFILIIIFIISLFITSLFSSSMIKDNVKKSSETLKEEGFRKKIYVFYKDQNIVLDNYTDALMINTAYSIDASNPFESMLVDRKNYIPGKTEKVIADENGELKMDYNMTAVEELYYTVNDVQLTSREYARYWHGYLVILRPLLLILDIVEIRMFFLILLSITFLISIYIISKKINILAAIIYFMGFLSVEYFFLGENLQNMFVFLITIIGLILILVNDKIIKQNLSSFFLITGMLTCFFDFLTNPIVSLFIPLITVLLLDEKENRTTTKKLIIGKIVKCCVMWGIGYGMTYVTKWVLVDIVLNRTTVKVAMQQLLYRSVTNKYSILATINSNLKYVNIWLIIPIIITIFISLIIKRKPANNQQNTYNNYRIFYLLISLAPMVWYTIMKNHSYNHSFFTYRNLVITIIGLCIYIYELEQVLTYKLENRLTKV